VSRRRRRRSKKTCSLTENLIQVCQSIVNAYESDICADVIRLEKTKGEKYQMLNREFYVAASIDSNIEYKTHSYQDAIMHCPVGYMIFTNEGIKVYPQPNRRVPAGRAYTLRMHSKDKNLGTYRDLQDAINNCPINCGVYDDNGLRVY